MVKMLHFPQRWTLQKDVKTWDVLISDLTLECSIGINPSELSIRQPVRINLRACVEMPQPEDGGDRSQFVCYDHLITEITKLATGRHIGLVETLAEEIAGICFEDRRVSRVWCRVEKTAVYPQVGSVGIEIERERL